jgi:hypothetical protein
MHPALPHVPAARPGRLQMQRKSLSTHWQIPLGALSLLQPTTAARLKETQKIPDTITTNDSRLRST